MERLLAERESISKDLANVHKRQEINPTVELANEEDSLAANLNYIQENISHVQHSIMEIDEGKENTSESQALRNMVEDIQTVEEAKFLLEKLCSAAVVQTCDIALTQTRLHEREAILNEVNQPFTFFYGSFINVFNFKVQQDSSIQQQLLQHVLSQNPAYNLPDSLLPGSLTTNLWSTISTASIAPSESTIPEQPSDPMRLYQSQVSSRSTSPHQEM